MSRKLRKGVMVSVVLAVVLLLGGTALNVTLNQARGSEAALSNDWDGREAGAQVADELGGLGASGLATPGELARAALEAMSSAAVGGPGEEAGGNVARLEAGIDVAAAMAVVESSHYPNEIAKAIAISRIATAIQAEWLEVELVQPAKTLSFGSPSAAVGALVEAHGLHMTATQAAQIQVLDNLAEPGRSALRSTIEAFLEFDQATRIAYQHADIARILAVKEGAPAPEELLAKIDSLQSDSVEAERYADELASSSDTTLADIGVNLGGVLGARLALLDTIDDLGLAFRTAGASQSSDNAAPLQIAPVVSIDLFCGNTNYGAGDDFVLLIDICGKDKYLNNAGGSGLDGGLCSMSPGAAALIDLEGNDKYISGRSCGANGGGFMGAGFLFDGGGNNIFNAGSDGTNGGGSTGGIGFLIEVPSSFHTRAHAEILVNDPTNSTVDVVAETLDSNSSFTAGTNGTNGGGAFLGVGALLNLAGNDQYNATFFSTNGAGGFGGLGTLIDVGGADVYRATDVATNGGAFGGGPFVPVTVFPTYGLLLDVAGDDEYSAGSTGSNGGGAFAGVGSLYDAAGNDTYVATDAGSNGGGAVFGAGLLVDASGNDQYVAGFVGVNGGGFLGAGFLIDVSGDDSYDASGVAANGGGSLGWGLLVDGGGSDSYDDGDDVTPQQDETIIFKGLLGDQLDF